MSQAEENDHSSCSEEDEDYIPSGDDESSDELEDSVEDDGTCPHGQKKKQRTKSNQKNETNTRRRKSRTSLEEPSAGSFDAGDEKHAAGQDRFAEALKEESEKNKEEQEKKKADDLWSSFLSDVGQKSKQKASLPKNALSGKSTTQLPMSGNPTKTTVKQMSQSNGSKPCKTVEISNVFDFAGEKIRVTKEVDAGSKEAKDFVKKQDEDNVGSDLSSCPSSSVAATVKPNSATGLKRHGGALGSILGQIGKKQKISTLEKSRLDWINFKQSEGIEEELKIHNKGKDGFVEKQRFLERTDMRQYEMERSIRMSQSKIKR